MAWGSGRLEIAALFGGALWHIAPSLVLGQGVAIQQPTVGIVGGSTAVSVPDRGRTVIGSVGRGASSRSVYGPFPSGTNTGRAFEGGSLSVHAWIHDFEELDRQALSQAEGRSGGDPSLAPADRADRARRELLGRDGRSRSSGPSGLSRGVARIDAVTSNEPNRGLSADELLERGRKAEAAGRTGVARAFYRQAQDRGSSVAGRELERLKPSTR